MSSAAHSRNGTEGARWVAESNSFSVLSVFVSIYGVVRKTNMRNDADDI